MSKIDISNLDLYYDDFQALKSVISPLSLTASLPSSALPAVVNPHC